MADKKAETSKPRKTTAAKIAKVTRIAEEDFVKTTANVTEAAERVADSTVGRQLNSFMSFIRQQGIVGLAVGLALGTQAGATVKAVVEGFINPIVGFLVGSQESLMNAKWVVVQDWNGRSLVFGWGTVASSLITLLAVAGVIYYVVHGLKLDKVDKKKDA